jgi:hypothetical protein
MQAGEGVGVVGLGGFHDRQSAVGEKTIVGGDQPEIDVDVLVPRGIVKTFGHAVTVGCGGDLFVNLGRIVLAVGILDMAQELRSLAQQVGPASQEVTGGTHLRWIDVGWREHAAAKEGSNLVGIDRVMLGLAAVDGFHREGVPADEGHALRSAEISEPGPR